MAGYKYSELINSLTEAEKKSFKKYLDSDYFHCSTEVKKLYTGLTKLKQPSQKDLFKLIYPNKTYNDKVYRYIVSDLNKHLEKFIILRQLETDALSGKIIRARSLGSRDCKKAYSLVHKEILKSDHTKNALYYLRQYEHSEWHLIYTSKNATRKTSPDYSTTINHLDIFYFLKKLQIACEVTNLTNILKTTYENPLIDEIKRMVTKEPFCNILTINIYYNILEILINPDNENNFKKTSEILRVSGQDIDPSELSEMYQYLKNYCVRKINQGESNYLKVLFDIYSDMLKNKSLWKSEYLSQWEFKNIVTLSLRLGETSWCEQFLKTNINRLNPGERKNALAYNTAYFHFMKNEFHKAIKKLQEVELTDVFYQLDARVIILKSYYELDETESFFYHTSAFRLYLLRNRRISEYQKTIYRNLIKFLSAVMRANGSKIKLKRIETKIKSEKNVADLKWLLLKVEEAYNTGK